MAREKRQNSLQEASPRSMWIDISVSLHNAMVHWPGDPGVRIERVLDLEHGDNHTLSQISMGSHTGTHIDAPLHFVRKGVGIDKMPLDITMGQARVIEIHDPESIKAEELVHHRIRRGERVLFKTRNSSYVWQTDEFVEDFVFLTQEAARFLAKCQVRLVGIDYLSVGGFKRDDSYVHQVLLGTGIWIIEGLNLSSVGAGRFDLICLPIKLERGDGAPARAVIRQVQTTATEETVPENKRRREE